MAVVVEQTLPFNSQTLDLQNGTRWGRLFPLIRPNFKAARTSKGHNTLVNEASTGSKTVRIAAVGSAGNFSSKLLDDRNIAAIVTETSESDTLTADAIKQELQTRFGSEQGIVVVRRGKKGSVKISGEELVEVETESELQQDHILHLLCHAKESCPASLQTTTAMLGNFMETAKTARSRFHTEKADGNPAVLHAEGASGFQKAKEAVARDLKSVIGAGVGQDGDVVYSVHFSDVNGLSRWRTTYSRRR